MQEHIKLSIVLDFLAKDIAEINKKIIENNENNNELNVELKKLIYEKEQIYNGSRDILEKVLKRYSIGE